MPIERESGLNLPNVMTPGAWVLLSVALVAVLIGVGFILYRVWSKRVKWVDLNFRGVQYFAQDSEFSADFLAKAFTVAVNALVANARWPASVVERALLQFKVYVFADDVNAGVPGRSGYQSGNILGVNRKLTTLCHEMGHLLHERIEKIVDYDHTRWMSDGFERAERVYSDWLHAPK